LVLAAQLAILLELFFPPKALILYFQQSQQQAAVADKPSMLFPLLMVALVAVDVIAQVQAQAELVRQIKVMQAELGAQVLAVVALIMVTIPAVAVVLGQLEQMQQQQQQVMVVMV
jgi:uncharacterized membrane protein YkvI